MHIECVPLRQSVFAIHCDGEPWREVHTSIFGRRPALPERCASLEEFSEQFSELEYRLAKHYALKRLSIQAMLSNKLAASLKQRLVSTSIIERLIEELSQAGYLNDQEWTASFVRVQSSRKVGPRAIAQKLAGKGVRGGKLEQALENSWDPEEQKSSIIHLLNTRYRKRDLSNPRERQKVIASLVRRGFDFSVILAQIS